MAAGRSRPTDAGQPDSSVSWPKRAARLPCWLAMRGTASSAASGSSEPAGAAEGGTDRDRAAQNASACAEFVERVGWWPALPVCSGSASRVRTT